MKRIFLPLFLLAFLIFSCEQKGKNLLNYDIESNSVQKVYEVTLDSLFIRPETDIIVIRDSTESWRHLNPTYVLQEFPMLDTSTFSDFICKNQQSIPVKHCIDLTINTIFLTDSTFHNIMKSGGWYAFYDMYPNSSGYLTVSAPGFNKGKTEALLYVSARYHDLAGGGYLIYMTHDGSWKIQKYILVWIS